MRSIGGLGFARRALASFHGSAGHPTPTFPNSDTKATFSFEKTAASRLHVQCSSSSTHPLHKEHATPCNDFAPLCEKPAAFASTVEELLKWRSWAQGMAMAIQDKYRSADGGPDSHDLLRELEWMLEDAVSHVVISGVQPKTLRRITNGSCGAFPSPRECTHFLDTETQINPRTVHLDTKQSVVDGAASLHGASQKVLKWPDIKRFELCHNQRLVCLRASLEELSLLWTERVQHRRPFQYAVGCAHWRDYILCVKEGVLIPRPETEQMIDLTAEALKLQPDLSKGVWADLGTGSGALAIGLAHLLNPQGSVVAVDNSNEAIAIASINVQRYRLEKMVKVLKGSWFSALENKRGKLAGVLSNPPYIPSSHISTLQVEVGRYEPRNALDGGHDGTNDLTTICHGAAWALQTNGCVILETNGGGQAEVVAGILESMPGALFDNIQLVKDFAGIVRFVKATHV